MSKLTPFSFPTVTYGIVAFLFCYSALAKSLLAGEPLTSPGALPRKGTKPAARFHRSKLRSDSLWRRRGVLHTRCGPRAGAQPSFCCLLLTRRACPMSRRTRHRYCALADSVRRVFMTKARTPSQSHSPELIRDEVAGDTQTMALLETPKRLAHLRAERSIAFAAIIAFSRESLLRCDNRRVV